MAFDATVGGASANSYVTVAAALSYFGDRLHGDEYLEADEETQQGALVMATARLDLEPYYGSVVTTTQRLQWPRYGAYDRNHYLLSSSAIPGDLQDATCELALVILEDPQGFASDTGLEDFQNLRLGSLDITPRSATVALPKAVQRLLSSLRIGGNVGRVVRA